jgi:predicted TPR repeat methyltransferase
MDFEKFYDNQPDYIAFRNDPASREYYDAAVGWKVQELVRVIPGGMLFSEILEVGCAFGVLLNTIADTLKIEKRTGVDISAENIKTATAMWPECSFYRGTVEEFVNANEIQGTKYSLVVLSDIVEHIPDDLGFMKSVRAISSYVVLNLPLEKSFKTRNRQYGESDPSGHLRCYDRDMAEKLVKEAGFEIVNSFTSIAFFDKKVYEAYKRKRSARIKLKPLPLRIFWTAFYSMEDMVKLSNETLATKIYGTNYFALLRSI